MDGAPKKKKLVIPAAIAVSLIGAAVVSAASCSKQESSCDLPGGIGGGGSGGAGSGGGCNVGGEGGSGGDIA